MRYLILPLFVLSLFAGCSDYQEGDPAAKADSTDVGVTVEIDSAPAALPAPAPAAARTDVVCAVEPDPQANGAFQGKDSKIVRCHVNRPYMGYTRFRQATGGDDLEVVRFVGDSGVKPQFDGTKATQGGDFAMRLFGKGNLTIQVGPATRLLNGGEYERSKYCLGRDPKPNICKGVPEGLANPVLEMLPAHEPLILAVG